MRLIRKRTGAGLAQPTRLEYVKWLGVPVLLYVFVVVTPILVGLGYSFTNWGGGKKISFIGLDNYVRLVRDMEFWGSFRNNLQIIVLCLVGQTFCGLLFAILLSSKFLRLRGVYRFIIFLPVVLSGVVVGFLWQIVYNNKFGLLNWFLGLMGMEGSVQMWLDDPGVVVNSIAMVLIWQYVGQNVVIFLSSLKNIPPDILEAAEIDGAGGIQKAWYVTMPLMRGTIQVCILLCITGNLKIFDHIWLMTRGGPGSASSVLAVYGYKISFEGMKFGYGSSVSIGIIVLSAALVLCYSLVTRRLQND